MVPAPVGCPCSRKVLIMRTWRAALVLVTLVVIVAAVAVVMAYRSDIGAARARLAAYDVTRFETRSGPLAYAEAGTGPAVLMIHGSGGGYDQGLAMTRPLAERGYRVIAPSRFGYPATPYPPDPSLRAQTDAYVDLLDALGLEDVVVMGGSAGAISAVAFAIDHPERTRALVAVVPAIPIPGQAPVEPWSPRQEKLVRAALRSDFLFWAAITLFPDRVTEAVLATEPALVAAASEGEQARVAAILDAILPVSPRTEGLLHDTAGVSGISLDYGAVNVPTLAISAEDDLYRTDEGARALAEAASDAELIVFPDGGHVWVGRNAELFDAIDAFIGGLDEPR